MAGSVDGAVWKMVPGLGDSGGVSFESVSRPGCYLKRELEEVRVEALKGASASFAEEATFYERPGFSDERWTSFESMSGAGEFLMQANGRFRVCGMSEEKMREAATWRIHHRVDVDQ